MSTLIWNDFTTCSKWEKLTLNLEENLKKMLSNEDETDSIRYFEFRWNELNFTCTLYNFPIINSACNLLNYKKIPNIHWIYSFGQVNRFICIECSFQEHFPLHHSRILLSALVLAVDSIRPDIQILADIPLFVEFKIKNHLSNYIGYLMNNEDLKIAMFNSQNLSYIPNNVSSTALQLMWFKKRFKTLFNRSISEENIDVEIIQTFDLMQNCHIDPHSICIVEGFSKIFAIGTYETPISALTTVVNERNIADNLKKNLYFNVSISEPIVDNLIFGKAFKFCHHLLFQVVSFNPELKITQIGNSKSNIEYFGQLGHYLKRPVNGISLPRC